MAQMMLRKPWGSFKHHPGGQLSHYRRRRGGAIKQSALGRSSENCHGLVIDYPCHCSGGSGYLWVDNVDISGGIKNDILGKAYFFLYTLAISIPKARLTVKTLL